jgi:hypothetical protein
MTRRSAFAIAGGLVGALVSTVTAFTIGLQARTHQLIAASSSISNQVHHGKPIVRTRTRTITVHRKGRAASGTPNVVHVVPPPTPPSAAVAPAAPAAPPATTNTGGSHASGAGADDAGHETERGDD